MFDRIAPIYERMNTVMTAGLDAGWRRDAVAAAGLRPGMSAVDVACGSGCADAAAGARRRARRPRRRGGRLDRNASPCRRVVAQRPTVGSLPAQADALALPLDDASVDAATIAFGLRNVADYGAAWPRWPASPGPAAASSSWRSRRPRAARPARWLSDVWFRRIVPLIGRAGRRRVGVPLPARQRRRRYPSPETIAEHLRRGRAGRRAMATAGAGDGDAPRRTGGLSADAGPADDRVVPAVPLRGHRLGRRPGARARRARPRGARPGPRPAGEAAPAPVGSPGPAAALRLAAVISAAAARAGRLSDADGRCRGPADAGGGALRAGRGPRPLAVRHRAAWPVAWRVASRAPLVFTHHTRFDDYGHYLGPLAGPGAAATDGVPRRGSGPAARR